MKKKVQKIENVIMVNEFDQPIGEMEKLTAHIKGVLHRAVSVFILNSKGEVLMQQRHVNKYHSGGLWSNACCGHPVPGELSLEAAKRRLYQEMGIKCKLDYLFTFHYKAQLPNALVENEIDHVYIGQTDMEPKPNPLEVDDWKFVGRNDLFSELSGNGHGYTEWIKVCIGEFMELSGKWLRDGRLGGNPYTHLNRDPDKS